MITMKSAREIEIMRRSGKITSSVLAMLLRSAKPGMTLREVDRLAEKGIREQGGIPTFKGYRGFPASICASVNEVVVHGIPGDRVLRDGDILSIDIGTTFQKYVSDSAATVAIGTITAEAKRLLHVTQECLMLGIAAMQKGNRLSDIGHAVQRHAEKNGYGVVRALVGHGVGRSMHEEPQVPNWGRPGEGIILRPGLVLAIEPMITQGTYEVRSLTDGWTIVTADGKLAAHFEHTIALTEEGPRILTLRDHDFMELDVAPYRPKEELAA
ncbi:MAG: type I methionyl aminopeptidase [Candidatus Eremiobacteraeota bacterium]|nr:type I methionyl aminopeptidase [Candidatus Eremiobacteraeota bacterium]MBC5802569.1 type I methionyl aminopeptidase [Candidatus Eremiobacteraeota bacterium]MBC5821858.1 type I methionyl aminopeptidase [Candidatus Eremiobacteraeota bacterium]